MEGGTLPIDSPLDGSVHETNHLLAAKPHLLSQQPFDEGWLCDLEVGSAAPEAEGLMTSEEAASKYAADQDAFLTSLQSALYGNRSQVGVTLADGGQQLQSIADMLGPAKYFHLVRKLFR